VLSVFFVCVFETGARLAKTSSFALFFVLCLLSWPLVSGWTLAGIDGGLNCSELCVFFILVCCALSLVDSTSSLLG